ncbi:hypothetical protein [Nocardioides soli]|uniref:Phage tail protein n=1 Tax=Nocardioides soli TaxID=1036020 RepID=A0A7W4VTC1_9ACTN|nr:hypothetical protein [Nocardioides soli]MBB3041022.1 hypothetical protein [Nocardioides soli]
MSRPQIIVNVKAALQRRGVTTDTGRAFLVYAGATGPAAPARCLSAADALAASVPAAQAAYVGDALTQGAPEVWVLRATAVDAGAVTESEWDAALAKLTADYGPGQVLIPGVSTSAAYEALLTHANASGRCVLLDGASNAAASALTTAAAGLAAAAGAQRAGMIAGWVTVPATGGGTRNVPGSVIAAGLAARGDGRVGHTNHAPAFDQGLGAGVAIGGTAVTVAYTDAELDSLSDAGVSVIRDVRGVPTLYDWKSVSDDPNFRQLNWGRMHMELSFGISSLVEKFLGRQIDGRGALFAELEGVLRGYFLPLWQANALYGAEPGDAFDVDTFSPNTPTTIKAGELHALAEVSLSPYTEKVVIDVTTSVAEGVAA